MNYRFVLRQLTPERRDYHFAVHVDAKASLLSNTAAQWQRTVYRAAVESVLSEVVLQWMLTFEEQPRFYVCQPDGPFEWPTVKGPGFQLLLVARTEYHASEENKAEP
jgi:hypothetical protein